MKKILAASALAIASLSVSPLLSAPAFAQTKLGTGVADLEIAAIQSNAYKAAMGQIGVTYKAQIDQADARGETLEAELNVLRAKANEEGRKTPKNQAAIDAAVKAYQDKSKAAQVEVNQLSQPFELARAYVLDQINLHLNDAVKGAMAKRKVDLLLNYNPQIVVIAEPNVDITDSIVAELNTLLPSVQIVPPAGYQAGQLTQQRNQAAMQAARAAQGTAPAPVPTPAPTGSKPTTR